MTETELLQLRRQMAEIEGYKFFDCRNKNYGEMRKWGFENERVLGVRKPAVAVHSTYGGGEGVTFFCDPRYAHIPGDKPYTPDLDLNHIDRVCREKLVSDDMWCSFINELIPWDDSEEKVMFDPETYYYGVDAVKEALQATPEQWCRALIAVLGERKSYEF